eukprot:gene22050-154_t
MNHASNSLRDDGQHNFIGVNEINASDSRTHASLHQQIVSSTANHKLFRKGGSEMWAKPKCLVMDEIDGLLHTAAESRNVVGLLAKMAEQPLNDPGRLDPPPKAFLSGSSVVGYSKVELQKPDATTLPSRDSKSSKSRTQPLCRPVICICNNPYAKAVRELKKVAEVIPVPLVTQSRLSNRLLEICRKEHLMITKSSLTELAVVADGDVRSCLNTLQLGQGTQSSSFGHKDMGTGVLAMMDEVFHRKGDKVKYQRMLERLNPMESNRNSQIKSDPGFTYVLRLAQQVPDGDKAIEGLFEQYPQQRYADYAMKSSVEAIDWLGWYDRMDHLAYQHQAFSLRAYLPFVIAQFHSNCSSSYKPARMSFPRTFWQVKTEKAERTSIVATFTADDKDSGSNCNYAKQLYYTPKTCVLDLLPYLHELLRPSIKINPAAPQLSGDREKEQLRNLAGIHLFYNIAYNPVRQEGKLEWAIDVEVERVATIKSVRRSRMPELSNVIRQILTQEIQQQRLDRMRGISKEEREQARREAEDKKRGRTPEKQKPVLPSYVTSSSPLGKNATVKAPVVMGKRTDMFGRTITNDPNKNKSNN